MVHKNMEALNHVAYNILFTSIIYIHVYPILVPQ